MEIKTFSIFGLSFLVMFTLTSCDNENLVNEEETPTSVMKFFPTPNCSC